MPAAHVFISYRRDDAAGYARAVYDALARRFGAERIFIDVDDIHAGQPFSAVIEQALAESAVLLVMIGRRWQAERDGAPPRLHDPTDLVRREVAAGLSKGLHVIPVLLDGAAMPTEAELPPELRPLAGRNAVTLHNARFADDMARLVARLDGLLGAPAGRSRRGLLLGAGAGVVALAAGAAALWLVPRGPATDRVRGTWQAEVTYGWSNARHVERFVIEGGDDGRLHGTASFLGVPRGLQEARFERDGTLAFVTRTQEVLDGRSSELVHRYRGRHDGDTLQLVMQTEGGSSPHGPVTIRARRTAP